MVLAKGIVHTQPVAVGNAKRLLPCFVIIFYALVAKWMIYNVCVFSVGVAVYIFILCIESELTSLQGYIEIALVLKRQAMSFF